MGKYTELVQEYEQKAKRKYELLKKHRRERRGLPLGEKIALLKQDRTKRLAWKQRIKRIEDPREHYAQKKGYKYYRKLQNRKIKWGIFIGFVALICLLMGIWYYNVSRPLNAEQQSARNTSLKVARQVADEGMVLLKNDNATLPLKDTNVNVFGAGAATPVYGGGGAGGISSAAATSFYTALKDAGISANKSLYNLYNNFAHSGDMDAKSDFKEPGKNFLDIFAPNIAGFLVQTPKEMPTEGVTQELIDGAKATSDTALYVISRAGTEAIDKKPEELRLNKDERDTLEILNKNFAHIVIVLNTTNVMELGFTEEFSNIDSVLWIGAPGEIGMKSVAAALKGDITPSGKLTDTYMYDIAKDPAVINTGDFQYKDKDGNPVRRYFANYQENVYVGYRYYETFDTADATVERITPAKTAVQYPFGYGLSYTTFDWKVSETKTDAETVRAKVTITNTGNRAGKDVAQLYFSAPFAAGGVERPAVELGAYAKTKLLQPGESETLTLTMNTRDMAAYDDTNAKAWVLDKGTYQISVRRDVKTIVENFAYTQPETVKYTADPATGQVVTNQFDDARDTVNYLSRSDVTPTNPASNIIKAPTNFTLPDSIPAADYKHKKGSTPEPTLNAENNLKLAELKGAAYDDPRWETFLDQLSEDELVKLTGHGGYWTVAIDRLSVPRTAMYDGPASIRGFLTSWATVAYPIPANLSASWNTTLAEEVGKAMGREAQSFGVDGVYGPSLNMHRSPLGGRNFEYYSEDPLIVGKTGAAVIRGLESTHTTAIMKHFVANDQETNRANFGLYTWTTEQALREIYLKPFEIAVKEGHPHGVMSAFNRVGTTWAGGNPALLQNVLRDEWGFKGFVITDAGLVGQGDHFDALQAVESGNDLMLASPIDGGANVFEKQLKDYLKTDRADTLNAMRGAAHNILYYVVQTSKVE